MNSTIFQGRWQDVRGQVKQQWSRFSEQDLNEIGKNQQEIYNKLQQYYGYSRQEAQQAINSFQNNVRH